MNYKEPLFRPPAEADSLIFQVAYSCPHNSCRFCGMYKFSRYEEREYDEVLTDFKETGREYPETQRVFLADGDAMFLSFEKLQKYLLNLNELFPKLTRVNVYANGSSILAKTKDQLCELRKLKLHTLYLGLETGDEELLKLVSKGETAEKMIEAVRISQECGLRCSVMVLLGLGGKKGSEKHALETARALNKMQPRLLSALRFVEVPGSKMFNGYEDVSEYGAVCELRKMIENLELERTVFRANHASNPVPMEGRFPNDKERILAKLDYLISSGGLDRKGPGQLPFWL
ncbi:MAG: radical SAM protein [Lentisphaerae bacterium]|nr:radical SAM protein [Lentisphaerota bacterium]